MFTFATYQRYVVIERSEPQNNLGQVDCWAAFGNGKGNFQRKEVLS